MNESEFGESIALEIQGRMRTTKYQLSDWYYALRNYTAEQGLELLRGYFRTAKDRLNVYDFKKYLGVRNVDNDSNTGVPRFPVKVEPYPYAAKVRVVGLTGQVYYGWLERRRNLDNMMVWVKRKEWEQCHIKPGMVDSVSNLGEAPAEWLGIGMVRPEPVGLQDLIANG